MLIIRRETPEDIESIRRVNEKAFGQDNESRLVDKLRNRGFLIISLIAVHDGEIVGHIAFSLVEVKTERASCGAIALAPMAVIPACQRRGIGSQLVRAGLEECRRSGCEAVFLVGHPEYYPRFGFVPARHKGFDCEFEAPDDAWMVFELKKGALAGKRGKVTFQPEFKECA